MIQDTFFFTCISKKGFIALNPFFLFKKINLCTNQVINFIYNYQISETVLYPPLHDLTEYFKRNQYVLGNCF